MRRLVWKPLALFGVFAISKAHKINYQFDAYVNCRGWINLESLYDYAIVEKKWRQWSSYICSQNLVFSNICRIWIEYVVLVMPGLRFWSMHIGYWSENKYTKVLITDQQIKKLIWSKAGILLNSSTASNGWLAVQSYWKRLLPCKYTINQQQRLADMNTLWLA